MKKQSFLKKLRTLMIYAFMFSFTTALFADVIPNCPPSSVMNSNGCILGFEESGWWWSQEANTFMLFNTEQSRGGSKSLKVTTVDTYNAGNFVQTANGSFTDCVGDYTLSFWVYRPSTYNVTAVAGGDSAVNNDKFAYLELSIIHSDGSNNLTVGFDQIDTIPADTWQQVSFTVNLNVTETDSRLKFVIRDATKVGVIYIDDIEFVSNAAPTPTWLFFDRDEWSMSYTSDGGKAAIDNESLKYSGQLDTATVVSVKAESLDTLDLTEGNNTVSFQIYIEDNTGKPNKIHTALDNFGLNTEWDLSNIATGEWVTLEQEVNIPSDGRSTFSLILKPSDLSGASGNFVFYVDDVKVYSSDAQPDCPTNTVLGNSCALGFEDGDWSKGYSVDETGAISSNWQTNKCFVKTSSDGDVTPFGGSQMMKLINGRTWQYQQVYKDITLPSGTVETGSSFRLSFGAYLPTGSLYGHVSIHIGTDLISNIDLITEGIARDQWVMIEKDFAVTDANSSKKIRVQIPKNSPGAADIQQDAEIGLGEGKCNYFYVDQISLTKVKNEPTKSIIPKDLDVKLYPNPASDFINISANSGSKISVFNVNGIELKHLTSTSTLSYISTNELKSGVYFVKVSFGENTVVKQFIINK